MFLGRETGGPLWVSHTKVSSCEAPRPYQGDAPKEPVVQAVLAQRSSRYELEDMVNELGDAELGHLVVRGVRILKKRLTLTGQGGGHRALNTPSRARWVEHCRRLRANFPASMNQTQTDRWAAVILFCSCVSSG
jgi:hypothetical protein